MQGDFNGDGIGDLAVGIPLEDVSGKADAGAVQILYGTSQGRVMSPLITQDSTGVADSARRVTCSASLLLQHLWTAISTPTS